MKMLWTAWALALAGLSAACSAQEAQVVTFQPSAPQTATERPNTPAFVAPTVAETPSVPKAVKAQGTDGPNPPRLYLLEGGIIARPLNNGAAVPIAKEISAEIFLAPYPPAPEGRLDLYLFEPRSGAPITDAEVIVKYEMLYMDHGQYRLNATEKGNGHYLAPLDFGMYGEWVVDVYAGSGEQSGSVRLKLVVAPS